MNIDPSIPFYDRLRTQLNLSTFWPAPYLFKFIVPSDPDKIAQITAIFGEKEAEITEKKSAKGSYTSMSIRMTMPSAQSIIDKYQLIGSIEGVISL